MKYNLPDSFLLREPGLQIIRLSGPPATLGFSHGQMLGPQIKHLRRQFLSYLSRLALGVGALPLYLLACLAAWRLRPFIPQPFWEEMSAVAEGARVHLSLIVLINVIDDLLNNIPRCSTFAASLGGNQPPEFILARNLDYPLFTRSMCRLNTVFMLSPSAGQPLISVAWPGYVGVCTGMNASRIALAQLTASCRETSLAGVPTALRNRLALQDHDSLLGVAARIASQPGTIGNNLLLTAPHDALLLETSSRHTAVRLPVNNILTATNHYQSPAMQALKGKAFRRPPFSPLPLYCFSDEYSFARDRQMQQLLSDGPIDIVQAQHILADPLVANPGDVTSAIFHPNASELYVAQSLTTPVSYGRYRRLSGLFGHQPQVI
ncbi:C45 family autoproteolytic acyltransferase/hydolase [Desulfobacca acetoxidans]